MLRFLQLFGMMTTSAYERKPKGALTHRKRSQPMCGDIQEVPISFKKAPYFVWGFSFMGPVLLLYPVERCLKSQKN